jgi:hypothetical protein
MHQQLWGLKVEDKLYLGVREQKSLNASVVERSTGKAFRPAVLAAPSITLFRHDHITCYGDDHTGIISLKRDLARQPSQINIRYVDLT